MLISCTVRFFQIIKYQQKASLKSGVEMMNDHANMSVLTYLDPLTPHFYIVKLGFTGVYIIFVFLLLNIDCGLEPRQ